MKRVDFKVADNVLMHTTRKTTRKGGIRGTCWTGPYIIKSVNNKGTYNLQGVKVAINGNRLKLFTSRYTEGNEGVNNTDKSHVMNFCFK